MMRALRVVSLMVMAVLVASPALAEFLVNGSFELNGGSGTTPDGWTKWLERGTAEGAVTTSGTPNDPAWPNHDGNWWLSVEGTNLNGGFWQQVDVSAAKNANAQLQLDGYWRSDPTAANSQWGEVIYFDGVFAPTDGADVDTNQAAFRDGNLANGELLWKRDTFSPTTAWDSLISATPGLAFKSSAIIGANTLPAPTSGTITIILKAGNVGGDQGVDYDRMTLTPDPATVLLLGLPLLLIRRRA